MPFGTPPFISHVDGNQVFTSMGVVGTLGTADTGGTAQALPFAVDAATGAAWNKEIGTPSVIVSGGTLQSGTVIFNPLSGSVLTTAVAVGTTAVAIPATALSSRKSVIMFNDGTAMIYLGGINVTSSGATRGIQLLVNNYSPPFDLGTTIMYGIGSTVGGTAVVMEIS